MADVRQVRNAGRGARVSRSVGDREHARPRQLLRPGRDPDLRGGGDDEDPGRLLGRRAADPQPADGRASMGLPRLCQRRARDPRGRHRPRAPLPAVRGAGTRAASAASARRWRSSRRCGPRRKSPTTAASITSRTRRCGRSRCRSRTRRSGWGSATRTRCAAPPRSPTAGWARAARASPISPPRCRS